MNEKHEDRLDDELATCATDEYPALNLDRYVPEEPRDDSADSPTDRYPILAHAEPHEDPDVAVDARTNGAFADAAPIADEDGAMARNAARERGVTHGLRYLETEVERLQEKWHEIDAELKLREQRVRELKAEIERLRAEIGTRDEAAQRLERARAEADATREAVERQLASAEARIEELMAQSRARDTDVGKLRDELDSAENRRDALQRDLDAARAEAARLEGVAADARRAAADSESRSEALAAERNALQSRFRELEHSVDARRQHWTELEARLAERDEAVRDLETIVANKEAQAAHRQQEKDKLGGRVADLERRTADLVEQGKTRARAYEALERALADQRQAADRLEADAARAGAEAERARIDAERERQRAETLEQDVASRDRAVTELEARLADAEAALHESGQSSQQHAETAERLGRELDTARTETDAMRAARERAEARLAELERAHEEARREADRLRADVAASNERVASLERDGTAAQHELLRAEERIEELERQREQLVDQSADLRAELSEREQRIGELEADLREKTETVDLLERNVRRITDLGASMMRLDREMSSSEAEPEHDPKADTERQPARESRADDADEIDDSRTMEIILEGEGSRSRLHALEPVARTRKLVANVDGKDIEHVLDKDEMTIGRGKASDIRISSHFISRTHARLRFNGFATTVEDAGSKNGTRVNAKDIERAVMLRHGDVISLGGEIDLRFVETRP